MEGGDFVFSNAAAGNVDDTITFVERLKINTSGSLTSTGGMMTQTNASQAGYQCSYTGTGAGTVSMSCFNDTFTIYDETSARYIQRYTPSSNLLKLNGTVSPFGDNSQNLGTALLRWSVVYSANGVNTSDEKLKENIKECDLGIDFINTLKPKSYNFKDLKEDNDAYGKKRYGLIAQDILETELKDSVFGKKDGEYGLSYNDVIAPMIKAIQELKAEIEILKNK